MNQKPEPIKTYRFDVLRYDASEGGQPRFQTYELPASARTSVLEALLQIQDRLDPSLAFRYACRGAICGSCAMSIGGKLNLACRVLLRNLPSGPIVIEPLPRFDVLKDLIVDMDPFWEKYEQVRPFLQAEISDEKESRMSERERQKIDQFVNCVLCALCCGACPVAVMNEDFTGPAALAKLYRFQADSRDGRDGEALEAQNSHDGMWGCHTITRCIEVCPKNVRPTDGIEGVRRIMLVKKLKSVFGGK